MCEPVVEERGARRRGVRRADPPAHQGDHRPVPAVAVGAAAAAAPGAVGGGVRQPGRHPVLRGRAGADHGRGLGGGHLLHDVQAHPVRRAPGERLHQHALRGAGRRRHLRASEGEARSGPRGDRGRARYPRLDHPRARRVPRGLRPCAGAAGRTTSTTTTRRRSRPRHWWTRCARGETAAPDPRRAAHRLPHASSWSSPGSSHDLEQQRRRDRRWRRRHCAGRFSPPSAAGCAPPMPDAMPPLPAIPEKE